MKGFIVGLAISVPLAFSSMQIANAQDAPEYMKQTYPEQAVRSAWAEHQSVMNPNGALDGRVKHLIALGVSAQIPCDYCVYFHTSAAKEAGATDAQIKEAVAAASLTRKWSTVLNGSSYDEDKFKKQVDAMFSSN